MRQRGVPDSAASPATEAGVAVFKFAYARWIGHQDLPEIIREALADLKAVSSGE